MNCPHFVASFASVCDVCKSRIVRALAIVGRFAKCDHVTSCARFGRPGSGGIRWCRDCGAIQVNDEGVWTAWELPLYTDEAIALDTEVMTSEVARPGRGDDSERKNVIPIKPRT